MLLPFTLSPGSSPRMRGARSGITGNGTPLRIIPADAGSTSLPAYTGVKVPDHPRGCGEHTAFW